MNTEIKFIFICREKECLIPGPLEEIEIKTRNPRKFISIAIYRTNLGYPEPKCSNEEDEVRKKSYFPYYLIFYPNR